MHYILHVLCSLVSGRRTKGGYGKLEKKSYSKYYVIDPDQIGPADRISKRHFKVLGCFGAAWWLRACSRLFVSIHCLYVRPVRMESV